MTALRRILAATFAGCLISPTLSSAGDSDGCWGQAPLLRVEWNSIPLDHSPDVVGEWRLPIEADRPEVVTEARVQLQLVQQTRSEGWKAHLVLSFPDPKPWGIPFTFQRAELVWQSSSGSQKAVIDWSSACTGPGRGLYPRQSWDAWVDLSSTGAPPELRAPTFRIWGSRN